MFQMCNIKIIRRAKALGKNRFRERKIERQLAHVGLTTDFFKNILEI